MNRIECPQCGHRLKYGDEFAGKKAKCQKCGHSFPLPPLVVEPPVAVDEFAFTPPNSTPPALPPQKQSQLLANVVVVAIAIAVIAALGYFFWWLGNRFHPGEAKAGLHTLFYLAAFGIWLGGGSLVLTLITGISSSGETFHCSRCFQKIHAMLVPPVGCEFECPHCHARITR